MTNKMNSCPREAVPIASVCRSCMSYSKNMRSLSSQVDGDSRTLLEILSYVTNTNINNEDNLPKQLCNECVTSVRLADSFKCLFKKSNAELKGVAKSIYLTQNTKSENKLRCENNESSVKNEKVTDLFVDIKGTSINGESEECLHCQRIFSNHHLLSQHITCHAFPYQCSICMVKYQSLDLLNSHVSLYHWTNSKHKTLENKEDRQILCLCLQCNEEFIIKKELNISCKKCEKAYNEARSGSATVKIEVPNILSDRDSPTLSFCSDTPIHKDGIGDEVIVPKSPVKQEIDINKVNVCTYCTLCAIQFETRKQYKSHCKKIHVNKKETKILKSKSDLVNRVQKDNKILKILKDDLNLITNKISARNVLCCIECASEFKSPKSYNLHVKKKHNNILQQNAEDLELRVNKCFMCFEQFGSLVEFEQHICNGKQIKVEGFLPHQSYHCSMCSRKFTKKESLESHIKKHLSQSVKIYLCSICKRQFKHQAHLDNHVLSIHSSDKGLKCEYCPKNFINKESLDLHLVSHQGQKKHQCKICAKGFNMLSTLKDHIRTHTGEKPFLCATCGRGFSQKTNLKEHMRRHQGNKPFKCKSCDQRFVSKGELVAHDRKHTGAHPFVCDSCGSGFTTSSSLVKHRRIHTGDKPYTCDFCPMRFTALGTLKNHRRTHTGEKPYKCSFCEKAFVQKSDLVSHIRCHTGERPYVCSTCGQSFRQNSALKTHLRMHIVKEGAPTSDETSKCSLQQD